MEIKLKPIQVLIVQMAKKETITPKKIMEKTNITYKTAQSHLYELEDLNLIRKQHPRLLQYKA